MPKQLKVALVAAVLLMLFMSAQGTAALWQAKETLRAGPISTGSLHLLAGNGASAKQNYAFAELNGANLLPGQLVQAPLVISNGGTTDLAYNLVGATTLPESATAADRALAASSLLTVKSGMSSAECNAHNDLLDPLYRGPASAEATFSKARNLTPGTNGSSSEVLCVRVEVPVNTPQTAAGGRLNLVLNFVGQQK